MFPLFDPNIPALLLCVAGWAVAAGLGATVTAAARYDFDGGGLIALFVLAAGVVIVALVVALGAGADVAALGVLVLGAVGSALMGVGAAVVAGDLARRLV